MSFATALAILAALASAIFAGVSWWYNKELSAPLITFDKANIHVERPQADQLNISFNFIFKNIGEDSAKIEEFRIGHYSNSEGFEEESNAPAWDLLAPGTPFSYTTRLVGNYNSSYSDEQIPEWLQKQIDDQIWIFRFRYGGRSIFEKPSTRVMVLAWTGGSEIELLTREEYEEIEEHIPEDFQLEN